MKIHYLSSTRAVLKAASPLQGISCPGIHKLGETYISSVTRKIKIQCITWKSEKENLSYLVEVKKGALKITNTEAVNVMKNKSD